MVLSEFPPSTPKINSGPWKLIYREELTSKTEAIIREKFLKSGQGREWRKNNIQI